MNLFLEVTSLKRQFFHCPKGDLLIQVWRLYFFHTCYRGPSWPWSYSSWIYNYLCNQCISPLMLWVRISIRARSTTLCDKVCQWLATGRWFSLGPPVSSTNKTDHHDITEILLKVALNTIKQTKNKNIIIIIIIISMTNSYYTLFVIYLYYFPYWFLSIFNNQLLPYFRHRKKISTLHKPIWFIYISDE